MKDNFTYIAVILDRSGSMAGVKSDTIGGFNAFLAEQRKAPGEALFTLVQFGSPSELIESEAEVPFDKVPDLTDVTYDPSSGSTALYDAIGYTIDRIGERLSARPESERPSKVLIMIQTDGQENSSQRYDRKKVASMIKCQREQYNWDFAFIGATEGAVTDAIELGVAQNFTAKYAATPAGTAQVFQTASLGVRNYRSSKREEYMESDALGAAVMNFFPDDVK